MEAKRAGMNHPSLPHVSDATTVFLWECPLPPSEDQGSQLFRAHNFVWYLECFQTASTCSTSNLVTVYLNCKNPPKGSILNVTLTYFSRRDVLGGDYQRVGQTIGLKGIGDVPVWASAKLEVPPGSRESFIFGVAIHSADTSKKNRKASDSVEYLDSAILSIPPKNVAASCLFQEGGVEAITSIVHDPRASPAAYAHLFNHHEFSDVKFKVESRIIPAHRVVLENEAAGPYFTAMFKHWMQEHSGEVEVTDVTYVVMFEILRFLYTGKAQMRPNTAEMIDFFMCVFPFLHSSLFFS